MNPMNMLKQYMQRGFTPQNILSKMNMGSNPIIANLINMAQKGDTEGIETFAKNICEQKGIDFNTEFDKFKNNFK